jgi:hypothetical protein
MFMVLWGTVVALLLRSAESLSCLDESGAAVDWWVLVKHPAESGGDGSGTGYVFATSKDSSSLVAGSRDVTDKESLFGKQLAGIYAGNGVNYVFYNDQTPDGKYSLDYGHSKGFFAYDGTSAFWVQHSVPHFPNYAKDGYLYGHGQEKYGQNAFCMTMSPDAIDDVAEVMKYSNGWIYDHKTDGALSNVEDIVNDKIASSGSIAKDVKTTWGVVKLFGKTEAVNASMVPDIVAPALKQTMLYQSWLNSGGPLGPKCPSSGYDVFDIKSLHVTDDDTHDTKVDHSKWAVAKDPSSSWFCGIDNNHVASQLKRSGLAACALNLALSGLMRGLVAESNACGSPAPSPSPPGPSPSPPGPSPSKCCHYHDALTACSAGEVCCSGSDAPYKTASSCSRYGAKHNCVWRNSECIVGSVDALVLV